MLCIIQDDPEELGTVLKLMGNIYEDAAFTVIAANYTNADEALTGIRPDSRNIRSVIGVVDEVPLIHRKTWLKVRGTSWAQRGWTFQEAVFPRK